MPSLKKNAAKIREYQLIVECPLAGGDLERDPTIEIKGAPRLLALCTFKNGTNEPWRIL